MTDTFPIEGHCACRAVRFSMLKPPMFVHCCHCTWCQRETGSAFAVNALIEMDNVEVLEGTTETIRNPSNSGIGQDIVRCEQCKIALWSHYGAARDKVAFVRVGTLADPSRCPPDIHIFTSTKQPWVDLSGQASVVEHYYRQSDYWPAESIARYKALMDE